MANTTWLIQIKFSLTKNALYAEIEFMHSDISISHTDRTGQLFLTIQKTMQILAKFQKFQDALQAVMTDSRIVNKSEQCNLGNIVNTTENRGNKSMKIIETAERC